MPTDPIVIIGAGPAGLTAAYELEKAGLRTVVLEKDDTVGGLARTVFFKGYRFDIGGHRFFTKVRAVNEMWHEVLGKEFLRRPRLSRIYYKGRFFDYPLKAANALRGLGLFYSIKVLFSYIKARLRPIRPERSLEDWVINRFGEALYRTFFKTYTEKVWGMACSEIGADWAAQRIRGLSLTRAVLTALFPSRAEGIKTLVDAFDYPRLGPGQMWETVQSRLNASGNAVVLGSEVQGVRHDGQRVTSVLARNASGEVEYPSTHVISSMPLRELIEILDPPPPEDVLRAAGELHYRDFLTVALIVDEPSLFPDNWIYIHDPKVKVGRIQNFGNWSPDMVPESGKSCLGFEYFCFEGDGLWTMPDDELIALARKEADQLGLAPSSAFLDGSVVRMQKAYPVYDADYQERIDIIQRYLEGFTNLHPVGRNGLHKYNNQDHSMFTSMLAVRNILGEAHDVWSVNADCEYHEEISARPGVRAPVAGHAPEPPTPVRRDG